MSSLNHRFIFAILAGLLASTLWGCSSPDLRPEANSSTATLNLARKMLGVRYRYGGESPRTGFDCSGLVYYVHRKAGIRLPRTTSAQFSATLPVSSNQLTRGDLVFFRISGPKVAHVGIYMGGGKFIHAPSSGKQVRIESMKTRYWKQRFVRGGRV